MKIRLRCFASVRELLGASEMDLELPEDSSVEDLCQHLTQGAPDLARLPFVTAVNREYAARDQVLSEGDEVALIPPISGGAPILRFDFVLSAGPLDASPLEEAVRSDQDGAVLTFAGVTRDHNEGAAVKHLSYEAYKEMARAVAEQLFTEAVERFAIGRVRIAHRLGEVPVGETSVLVVVSAGHRGPVFDACRYLIDELKKRMPIFKREQLAGPGGETRWIGELPPGVDR